MDTNTCIRCEKWREKQIAAFTQCESVFDVADDMKRFEDECIKTCPLICDDSKEN